MSACSVCGAVNGEHPCQTPSGHHWYEANGSDQPMPALLLAALTDPILRTPEQAALLAADEVSS